MRAIKCVFHSTKEGETPLLPGEALVKLPSATAHYLLHRKVFSLLLSADQFSGGMQAGAEAMVAELRAMLAHRPDLLILSMELENVFGAALRASALREVMDVGALQAITRCMLLHCGWATSVWMLCSSVP